MRDKRAVLGRSRPYDELVTAFKKMQDPAYEEPPKKETKAERKEKKEKEKAEKRRKEMIEKGLDPDAPVPPKAGKDGAAVVLGPDGEPITVPKKKKVELEEERRMPLAEGAGRRATQLARVEGGTVRLARLVQAGAERGERVVHRGVEISLRMATKRTRISTRKQKLKHSSKQSNGPAASHSRAHSPLRPHHHSLSPPHSHRRHP